VLHLVLFAAVLAANTSLIPGLSRSCLIALHARSRYPTRQKLIVVSPAGRFALPAEGRFDLRLTPATRIGGFWVELVFDDRPGSPVLLIRDQFTDLSWRRLRVALREWI